MNLDANLVATLFGSGATATTTGVIPPRRSPR
jgi:uncharacterized membrane protein YuzA (DUF378 family)